MIVRYWDDARTSAISTSEDFEGEFDGDVAKKLCVQVVRPPSPSRHDFAQDGRAQIVPLDLSQEGEVKIAHSPEIWNHRVTRFLICRVFIAIARD